MKKNDAALNFRLPSDLKDALEARAAADRRKVGDVIRLAIEEYLKDE